MEFSDKFVRSYGCGDVVFAAGEEGREMFVVISGCVEIVGGNTGDILLATLREGDIFGELALIGSGRRLATARVADDGTRLVSIDQARFVYLVSQQPAFALSIMRVMAQRMAPADSVPQPDCSKEILPCR